MIMHYNCTVLQSGFTALHVAARYGNDRVALVLTEYGADVNFVAKVCHTSGVVKDTNYWPVFNAL